MHFSKRALCFLIVLFHLNLASAQDVTTQDTLDHAAAFEQLSAIKGGWFQVTDLGDVLEEWKKESDSLFFGRNYRVRSTDGDTSSNKTYEIRLKTNGQVVFTTRFRAINDYRPIDFKLISFEDFAGLKTFVFENTKYEYPKRIIYAIDENRRLTITQEGERNFRARVEETVYEREFVSAEREMYFRLGMGAYKLNSSGTFFDDPDDKDPIYEWRPGWEVAAKMVFKGRGGFMRLGLEVGLSGRYSFLDTASFTADTFYLRNNIRYHQSILHFAFTPELRLGKADKASIFVGPYASRLLLVRAQGQSKPDSKGIFNSSNDLKKVDFGLIGGVNIAYNPWKADIAGRISLRAWLGLSNIDNLFVIDCATCSGKVTQRGFSVSYMVNLMKS
jgi:hypothetical protein